MPGTKSPCSQKESCTIPRSGACTANQSSTCGIAIAAHVLPSCPKKGFCPIPTNNTCTAGQFKSCGMANTSIDEIIAVLGQPQYACISNRKKAELLSNHFTIFIDPDEVCCDIPIPQIAAIIKARIDIKLSQFR